LGGRSTKKGEFLDKGEKDDFYNLFGQGAMQVIIKLALQGLTLIVRL
jgi:hypothetical protein